jgi:hypothetical protein
MQTENLLGQPSIAKSIITKTYLKEVKVMVMLSMKTCRGVEL